MAKLRSCPRCGGNVVVDRNYHGWYEQCIQCGYFNDLPYALVFELQLKAGKEVAKNVWEA